jgi:hypothetical protein
MEITIRKAIQQDCHRMMELVKELAIYEKSPDEITVPAPTMAPGTLAISVIVV